MRKKGEILENVKSNCENFSKKIKKSINVL